MTRLRSGSAVALGLWNGACDQIGWFNTERKLPDEWRCLKIALQTRISHVRCTKNRDIDSLLIMRQGDRLAGRGTLCNVGYC